MTNISNTFSKWCMKCCNKDIGLLSFRIALGGLFLIHGIQKLSHMKATIAFFHQIGINAFFTWITALVETLGGLAILLGVLMVPAGILIAITMIVAIIWATGKNGFIGGWEWNALLILISAGLVTTGPGKYALSDKCKMTCHKDSCGHSSCPECKVYVGM